MKDSSCLCKGDPKPSLKMKAIQYGAQKCVCVHVCKSMLAACLCIHVYVLILQATILASVISGYICVLMCTDHLNALLRYSWSGSSSLPSSM